MTAHRSTAADDSSLRDVAVAAGVVVALIAILLLAFVVAGLDVPVL